MRKRDELADPASCLSRARDDEWAFVLLGRDAASPATIRFWAAERMRLGKNKPTDIQIIEALATARAMEAEAEDECPGHGRRGTRPPCCDRAGEYNGFASGPTVFTCPKSCSCHD